MLPFVIHYTIPICMLYQTLHMCNTNITSTKQHNTSYINRHDHPYCMSTNYLHITFALVHNLTPSALLSNFYASSNTPHVSMHLRLSFSDNFSSVNLLIKYILVVNPWAVSNIFFLHTLHQLFHVCTCAVIILHTICTMLMF